MALTEAQKRANRNDELRRKALGDVKITIWLSAGAKVRLDELTARHGTRQKALEAALTGLDPGNGLVDIGVAIQAYQRRRATHVAPEPSKPAQQAPRPLNRPTARD